jgi:hypothetical protein
MFKRELVKKKLKTTKYKEVNPSVNIGSIKLRQLLRTDGILAIFYRLSL